MAVGDTFNRRIVVTSKRQIKDGKSAKGNYWRLIAIEATSQGKPIEYSLTTFNDPPIGVELDAEFEERDPYNGQQQYAVDFGPNYRPVEGQAPSQPALDPRFSEVKAWVGELNARLQKVEQQLASLTTEQTAQQVEQARPPQQEQIPVTQPQQPQAEIFGQDPQQVLQQPAPAPAGPPPAQPPPVSAGASIADDDVPFAFRFDTPGQHHEYNHFA